MSTEHTMSAKKLEEAIERLDKIGQTDFRSDPDKADALREQYEVIVLAMAEEVLSLGRVVKSISEEPI